MKQTGVAANEAGALRARSHMALVSQNGQCTMDHITILTIVDGKAYRFEQLQIYIRR